MIAKNLVRLGEGAGTSRAWLEPAYDLAERGQLDFLLFECLAERTIAFAQLERLAKPDAGYDPLLLTRLRGVLAPCYRQGTRILTNAGAANPPAAGRLVVDLARSLGLRGLRVGVVTGDDVLTLLDLDALVASETGRPLRELEGRIVSANAYLGAGSLAEALGEGAHVVVGGRIADPCLALAALRHSFGWGESDWGLLGAGIAVGHLTECGPQVTGGYFADPGRRDVPDLAHIGYPVAECRADGTAVVTKLPGSGGLVSVATCTEQLLYEVHDPSAYFTPDVIADFSNVRFAQEGPDRVRVQGAGGLPAPATLKVAVGYRDGYIGEAQLSYGGTGPPGGRGSGRAGAADGCALPGAAGRAAGRQLPLRRRSAAPRRAARGTGAGGRAYGHFRRGRLGGQPQRRPDPGRSLWRRRHLPLGARGHRHRLGLPAPRAGAAAGRDSGGVAMRRKLRDLAHARAGDKGDISSIVLVVDDPAHYDLVRQQVTPQRVKEWFGALVKGEVQRYEVPQLGVLNFVCHRALFGGVTRSLAVDPHGKSRGALLLEMEVDLP